MSTIGSYPTRTFKESQKFLVLDPETQSTSLVLGRDLVEYITPQSTYVFAEQSRAVAQNEDYQIGALIQTAGDLTAGDNFAGTFLVVPGGGGDFPMANGNDLLIIKGDILLREQLASNTPAKGSDLIAHTGTSDTVTEALDKRTIYVGSVAELEGLSLAAGVNVYLTEDGKSGPGVIKTGTPPSDPNKGVNIVIANGNYWQRRYDGISPSGGLHASWFGADATGTTDSAPAINAALLYSKGQKVILPEGVVRIDSTIFIEPVAWPDSGEAVYRKSLSLHGAGATNTTIDSRVANGPAIRIAGEDTATVARWTMFPDLWGFTITCLAGTKPSNSHGITYNACRFGKTRQVFIRGITGDGIRLEQELNIETDQPAFMKFEEVFVRQVGGYGVFAKALNAATTPGVSTAYIDFDTCQVEQCDTGGLYLANFSTVRFRNGAISTCGSVGNMGGITIEPNERNSQNLILEENEIGNACVPYIAQLGGINGFHSKRNRYGTIPGENAPTIGLQFGTATSNNNIFVSEDDYLAFSENVSPFTMYKTVGNADKVRILNPQWFVFDFAGQTRYDFSSDTQDVQIVEDTRTVVQAGSRVHTQTVTNGSYTVDLLNGHAHRLTVTTTASLTVNPPSGALVGDGKTLTFHIINNAGSTFTPSFGSGFVALSVPSIPANGRITGQFYKDPVSGWVQVGAWGQ